MSHTFYTVGAARTDGTQPGLEKAWEDKMFFTRDDAEKFITLWNVEASRSKIETRLVVCEWIAEEQSEFDKATEEINKYRELKSEGQISFEEKKELLAEHNDEAKLADGLEDALIGMCSRFGQSMLAAYDYDKCVQVLMKRDGMTEEEANEYLQFNTLGAWVGENTPVFLHMF